MITPEEITAIHDHGETVYRSLNLYGGISSRTRQFFNYELPALASTARDMATELARLRRIEAAATAWWDADQAHGAVLFSDDGSGYLVASEALTNATNVLAEVIDANRKA